MHTTTRLLLLFYSLRKKHQNQQRHSFFLFFFQHPHHYTKTFTGLSFFFYSIQKFNSKKRTQQMLYARTVDSPGQAGKKRRNASKHTKMRCNTALVRE